jgi:hypothetical protein
MNTTILSYPGFQTLPKGVRRMLVASEAHFFDQPASHHKEQEEKGCDGRSDWESLGSGEVSVPEPHFKSGPEARRNGLVFAACT